MILPFPPQHAVLPVIAPWAWMGPECKLSAGAAAIAPTAQGLFEPRVEETRETHLLVARSPSYSRSTPAYCGITCGADRGTSLQPRIPTSPIIGKCEGGLQGKDKRVGRIRTFVAVFAEVMMRSKPPSHLTSSEPPHAWPVTEGRRVILLMSAALTSEAAQRSSTSATCGVLRTHSDETAACSAGTRCQNSRRFF